MKKEFIPYEQALALKKLGFDEPTMASRDMNNGESLIQIPLKQQAFRWFREKYNIHSFIIPLIDEVGFVYKYQARVHTKESAVEIIGEFETYEEAELACLEKLIEMAHPNK